jgi:predicted metalloendopeptidase
LLGTLGWTETADGSFTPISECFVRQYSQYMLKEGILNGALTLDENVPDNGGLTEAFFAFKNELKVGKKSNNDNSLMKLPGLEGLTEEQLFFLGYANVC